MAIAKRFKRLPSEILNIEDEYTAFCFDEACTFILSKLEDGETPMYIVDDGETKKFENMEDFYKSIGVE